MRILQAIPTGWLTLLLWLISVILAIVEIAIVRDLVMTLYALVTSRSGPLPERYGEPFWSAVTLGNVTVLALAIATVVFVVGTGEYHYRRQGTRGSWRLFAQTFAVELAILLLGFLT